MVEMSGSRSAVDFTVEKPGEGILLLVEARNVSAPSKEWATQFLKNLFAHLDLPRADYFLLALQDHLYLWRNPTPEAAAPDFAAETTAELRPYLELLPRSLDTISQSGFELLIQAWLGELVAGTLPDSADRHWLEESGLGAAVKDAFIRFNIAA